MAEYILRDQAIIAVTGAKLPDVSASGLPIANGKRSVTDCVRRLKEIPAADVLPVKRGKWNHVRWVKDDDEQEGGYWISRCSNCSIPYNEETPFCPHCGADMRRESRWTI